MIASWQQRPRAPRKMSGRRLVGGALVLISLVVSGALSGCASLNNYPDEGVLALPGLAQPARVLRDENGMAYIYAGDLEDAFLVMGFVTAQDRLFRSYQTQDLFVPEGSMSAVSTSIAKLNEDYVRAQARRMSKLSVSARSTNRFKSATPKASHQWAGGAPPVSYRLKVSGRAAGGCRAGSLERGFVPVPGIILLAAGANPVKAW